VKQTQRHESIIELVRRQGYVSTEELVEHFQVSPQTIRRDLNELAEQNRIQRHHGGAALTLSSAVNAAYHDRKVMLLEEKKRIAERVASQIPDGATLFIDIGTTPEAVAHALMNHKNLRVVTNNLNVATLLMSKKDCRLILAGGEVRSRDGGIVGEATLDFISQFRLDYGILGISGIDIDGSLLEFDYHEVRTKRAIIENSRSVMLVTDHTKFGRNAMVNLGKMELIDYLFVDQMPPPQIQKVIEQFEVKLEIC
jgi:DeoR family glycerol-3-phosphate regulon repressor